MGWSGTWNGNRTVFTGTFTAADGAYSRVAGGLQQIHQIGQIHPTAILSSGRDVLGLVPTTVIPRGARDKASPHSSYRKRPGSIINTGPLRGDRIAFVAN
jgi:hypothetical protein